MTLKKKKKNEIEELLNIDPDSYVKGVEEGKRNAMPSIEKQSEIIAQIDKLIENMKKQCETIEKLRTTLLVQWLVKGDEKKFREIMMAERFGESYIHWAKTRAVRYFKTFIEEWRKQHQPRTPCPDCNGTGFIHGTCCRKCEGSMSLLVNQ